VFTESSQLSLTHTRMHTQTFPKRHTLIPVTATSMPGVNACIPRRSRKGTAMGDGRDSRKGPEEGGRGGGGEGV
jgi:hypothetical protein